MSFLFTVTSIARNPSAFATPTSLYPARCHRAARAGLLQRRLHAYRRLDRRTRLSGIHPPRALHLAPRASRLSPLAVPCRAAPGHAAPRRAAYRAAPRTPPNTATPPRAVPLQGRRRSPPSRIEPRAAPRPECRRGCTALGALPPRPPSPQAEPSHRPRGAASAPFRGCRRSCCLHRPKPLGVARRERRAACYTVQRAQPQPWPPIVQPI